MNRNDVLKLMESPREELVYGTGWVLSGFSVKYKDSTVLLVLKARGSLGGNQVSFIEAATLADCWAFVAAATYTTSVSLQWRKDNFSNG